MPVNYQIFTTKCYKSQGSSYRIPTTMCIQYHARAIKRYVKTDELNGAYTPLIVCRSILAFITSTIKVGYKSLIEMIARKNIACGQNNFVVMLMEERIYLMFIFSMRVRGLSNSCGDCC